jgi:uncharacterized phage-associated protein
MENLKDIIRYFFSKYPYPSELSKARLVKLIYLADWKSSLNNEKQLSNIKWIYNHYGPYVEDIINEIRNDSNFEIVFVNNSYNQPKELIKVLNNEEPKISKESKEIIDFVIDKTKSLYWNDFINLVYSTYPILKSQKFEELDLEKLAKEYKNTL